MAKTFVYNTGTEKSSAGDLGLSFGVFFDGTLNNMKNAELRQSSLKRGKIIYKLIGNK